MHENVESFEWIVRSLRKRFDEDVTTGTRLEIIGHMRHLLELIPKDKYPDHYEYLESEIKTATEDI